MKTIKMAEPAQPTIKPKEKEKTTPVRREGPFTKPDRGDDPTPFPNPKPKA